jgi:molybdate transport system permease protein
VTAAVLSLKISKWNAVGGGLGALLALSLLVVLVLPMGALVVSSSPAEIWAALGNPLVAPALWLSLRTTLIALGIVLLTGTPLAWFLATSNGGWGRVAETLVKLPVVMPPAVVGVALLLAFGRQSVVGSWLREMGVDLPFSTAAVVVAQVVVAAPFFVLPAAEGFRRIDRDLLLVARTLGASPARTFFRVAIPVALPAILGGAALCWARAVGEFGATLLFAGSLPGRTQTMPLAIYRALESDISVARALSLVLGISALVVLWAFGLGSGLSPRGRRARSNQVGAVG